MSKSPPKPSDEEQSRRFIETARELGCDEDEAAFDEKLRRIATAKPKPKAIERTPRRPRSIKKDSR
jgi:hypothetical protein